MFRIACHTTYTQARENFAELWDKAIEDREIIIINRKNHEDVALIAASELAQTDEGKIQTIDDLKREVGLA
jgi:antitoxin YefM